MNSWQIALGLIFVLVAGQAPVGAQEAKETQTAAAPSIVLETEEAQISYMIGQNMARNFKMSGYPFSLEALVQGMEDMFKDTPSALSPEDLVAAQMAFQKHMQAKQEEEQMNQMTDEQKAAYLMQKEEAGKASSRNREEGAAFIAEKAKEEGVTLLPSGLAYRVLQSGEGKSPAASDTVQVHYTGTRINGEKFDSSVDRGQPASFGVGQVIPGWTEALQLMKEGDKWEVYIPADLAYGDNPRPGVIKPGDTLVFEVELLKVL